MLYNKEFYGNKKEEFIFDTQIYNEDIDVKKIAAIQEFYEKNQYIPEKYIGDLLNWITYRTRKNICYGPENPMYSSFAARCAVAQGYVHEMFKKFEIKSMSFNVGDVFGKVPIHALECVEIPTKVDGVLTNKTFILDSTFRQFCIKEENRFERYNEEPRFAVKMSTPHPGYFLGLTENGKNFANNLINLGYFEVNAENLKTYFDAFSLYLTPKEAYSDASLVGKISTTNTSGEEYWNAVIYAINNHKYYTSINNEMDLSTPKQIVNTENKRILNIMKRIILSKKNTNDYTIEEELDTDILKHR